MATTDEDASLPPPYTERSALIATTGYKGQQPATAVPPGAYYPAPPYFSAAVRPAYNQQQTTAVFNVVGGAPVAQNPLVVQTFRRTNVQIPGVYPGAAFCKFTPGILETFIRSLTVVRSFGYSISAE